MRAQKGELLERLSSARSFSNMDDEENYSAASKAVRQVGDCSGTDRGAPSLELPYPT